MTYRIEVPSKKSIADVFNRLAEHYDSWYDRNTELFEREVIAVPLPVKPSLEVGCGSGRFMERFKIDVGVDLSERLLKIARSRGCEVLIADGEQLPFRDNTFSSAYLIFTLCFLLNPESVLTEIRRVLRGDGMLTVCIVPRDSGLGMELSSKNSHFYRIARFYREQEVKEMLTKAGFKVTCTEKKQNQTFRERFRVFFSKAQK